MTHDQTAKHQCSTPDGRLTNRKRHLWPTGVVLCGGALLALCLTLAPAADGKAPGGDVAFKDAKAQAAEFIAKYHSVSLTPGQRKVRQEALSSIPAPCCQEFSIETCCCPCNLAKSVWGLASMLIAERGYDAAQVNSEVKRWIQFTNVGGYTGDACHQGGCGRPFDKNGCGGMNEKSVS